MSRQAAADVIQLEHDILKKEDYVDQCEATHSTDTSKPSPSPSPWPPPQASLEKLTAEDFIIDLGQREAWRDEGTRKVAALKASIAEENVSNELVGSRMKAEFWESMEAPAVTLHAMVVPGVPPSRQQGVKVNSFTVPKALPSTTATRGYCSLLRKVELKLEAWEAAETGVGVESYRPAACFETADTFANGIARVLTMQEQAAANAAKEEKERSGSPTKGAAAPKKEEEEAEEGDDKGEGGASTDGGGGDEGRMLYAPFELHPKWRKVCQIAMHGEVQGSLKGEFNEKLKGLVNYKRAELEKIREKQARIGEIEIELSRLGSASPCASRQQSGFGLVIKSWHGYFERRE